MKILISLSSLSLMTVCPTALPAQEELNSWRRLEVHAAEVHGELGARAAEFLAQHRPQRDSALAFEVLRDNLDLALAARETHPWAREVPEELFFNDVLPYAVLDEARENQRPEMLAVSAAIVSECKTASEAAQALNKNLFNAVNVHYNTGRKAPNQSPAESRAQGRATCTGLSILLVDACRSVGVPARVAGVASWNDDRGNHTWVEIWDRGWHFLGADEYDAKGLDRAWFVGDASRAKAGEESYAVWATSWKPTGSSFPMVWSPKDESVPAVDVTERYAPKAAAPITMAERRIRTWERKGGERFVCDVTLFGPEVEPLASGKTRAERADLNDMLTFTVPLGAYTIHVQGEGWGADVPLDATEPGSRTVEVYVNELVGMIKPTTNRIKAERVEARRLELIEERAEELAAKRFVHGTHELRYEERVFGEAPKAGRSLWISMHGGGGAPPEVNDQQWKNQLRLYEPEEGIYIAPRAPSDTWDLWHTPQVDPLFQRLIETYVAARGVDPNRVYLMGYSAGGDGVYQLAPRMADRFAAASMMAGHPNETKPDGLRNLPFAIFMGGKDAAYDRNKVAERFGNQLAALREADPEGYECYLKIYPDHAHWMNGDDKEALPWMAQQVRNPWPKRVVWLQDNVTHERFYWLQVAPEDAKPGRRIVATVDGQKIHIESSETSALTLLLTDELVDLDQPLEVFANGDLVFRGRAERRPRVYEAFFESRFDPAAFPTASLSLRWLAKE